MEGKTLDRSGALVILHAKYMALTPQDLQAIKDVVVEGVGTALEDVIIPRLAHLDGGVEKIDTRLGGIDAHLTTITTRLDALDVTRDLVRILEEKKVLTAAEAASVYIHFHRPAT